MTIVKPGVQPRSRRPASKCSRWRKASSGGGLPGDSTPTRGTLGACAPTAMGMAKRTRSTRPVKIRRAIVMSPPNRVPWAPALGTSGHPSFEHLICLESQGARYGETEGLGGSAVDHEFELCWFLDRDVSRLDALKILSRYMAARLYRSGKCTP